MGDEVAASEVLGIYRFLLKIPDFFLGFLKQAEHAAAEEKLQEEMATLSRFDTELKELNRVVKEKKAMVSQADLNVQEFQHDIQVLTKDKTSASNKVGSLEATYEWIEQDKECGLLPLSFHILGADGPFFVVNSVILGLSMTGVVKVSPTLTIR